MYAEYRKLFPVTDRFVYLNHAAVSPPPLPVINAVVQQLLDVQQNGSANYKEWVATKDRARQQMSELFGCRPEQVAFMRNTSDGLSTIANGFGWRSGDNIVTFEREFPSNLYPWLNVSDQNGVEIRMCREVSGRADPEELINLIDNRTRIVALSSVQYSSGFRSNLNRIGQAARKHDALFVVDVIQSLGVIPLDVDSDLIDIAAGAGHKWLLAPEGVGYLFISDRARERLHPSLVGWVSVKTPEDYDNHDQEWKDGALAWETGTGATSLFYGLDAALSLQRKAGTRAIFEYLVKLTDYLCGRLEEKGYVVVSSRHETEKSQIVCVEPREGWTPMALYSRLKKAGIITAPRGGRLRISPHLYNSESDIDALINELP